MSSPLTIVNQYAAAVRDGSLPSCQMVRLAVERWYKDQEREDIYFDRKAFTAFVNFTRTLKHFKGEFAGMPIELEPWQLFIAANIFGWKLRSTRKRRYTYADVYVPRKNGKTTFAAVIALYMLVMDGESAAEVYAAAVDKEQAKICFDASAQLVQNSGWGEYVKYFRKGSIVVEETASAYKPLSKDTKNKDGLNIHCGICDERHAWRTNEIWDVLVSGTGARSQSLIFSISTAGFDTSYPYFDDLASLRKVMTGQREKDNHFILLYEPDEDDKWDDPATWRKVNPNFGVSLSEKFMEDACKEAKERGGTVLANFQTKNLNMWVDAPDIWLPDSVVAENNAPFDQEQLKGAPCYVGLDLAATKDITATALYFPTFGVVKYIFVVPEDKLKEDKNDIVDYRRWREQGWLLVCPGSVLTQEWFLSLLLKELAPYKVKKIAFDPWHAWELEAALKNYYHEEDLVAYKQDMHYMCPPTSKIEEHVLKREFNFLDNPIIRWMFGNTVVYRDPRDPNNNYRPHKGLSKKKIDGVVALVDAVGVYESTKDDDKAIYVNHGLRTISNNQQ